MSRGLAFFNSVLISLDASLAQLVEQRILNPKVAGSIPSRRTICTNGGTGIRARQRIWCPLRVCEFDSHFVHHS